jgi:hypothetical protein
VDWIKKSDLLREQRSQKEFECMCAAGVWGTDSALWPSNRDASIVKRPEGADPVSKLREPQVHDLLRCVCAGMAAYQEECPDASDWGTWGTRLQAIGTVTRAAPTPVVALSTQELIDLPEEPSWEQARS